MNYFIDIQNKYDILSLFEMHFNKNDISTKVHHNKLKI